MPQNSRWVVPSRSMLLGPVVLALSACSSSEPPLEPGASEAGAAASSTAELAAALVAAMGGRAALEGADTLVLRGDGTRTRMGQIAQTGGEDPMGSLAGVTETIDLANGRAAFDYDVVIGEFRLHRTEVLTSFEGEPVGWNTGPNRPAVAVSPNGLFSWASQNTPEMLLSRNAISVALAAAETASAQETPEERAFNGTTSLFGTATLPSGESVELYFNPTTGLLDGFATLDTETMLGDVDAEYVLADYRPVGGLVLPHSLTIRKQGRPYSSVVYNAITVNDPAALSIFTVPESAVEQAREVVAADGPWAPLTLNEVAPGIYHAVGYSHHSMVVEFPTFVAVIEGPYTEAQARRSRAASRSRSETDPLRRPRIHITTIRAAFAASRPSARPCSSPRATRRSCAPSSNRRTRIRPTSSRAHWRPAAKSAPSRCSQG